MGRILTFLSEAKCKVRCYPHHVFSVMLYQEYSGKCSTFVFLLLLGTNLVSTTECPTYKYKNLEISVIFCSIDVSKQKTKLDRFINENHIKPNIKIIISKTDRSHSVFINRFYYKLTVIYLCLCQCDQ